MTANQKRASEIATRLIAREDFDGELADGEWELLLLAAGLNNVSAKPHVVARLVLQNAEECAGYFKNQGCEADWNAEGFLGNELSMSD